jgi:hypothetical protein
VAQVKPLIWVEALVENYTGSRIEYMIKAKAQFKKRSTANNVEIYVPVSDDADSPKFRVGCLCSLRVHLVEMRYTSVACLVLRLNRYFDNTEQYWFCKICAGEVMSCVENQAIWRWKRIHNAGTFRFAFREEW